MPYPFITQTARAVPFEPARNPDYNGGANVLTAQSVQEAIEELSYIVSISASPGFTWGRSGTVNQNTWLLNDSVPSNSSGRVVFLNSAEVIKVFTANQSATAGIIVEIYSHDGNSVNLTLLGSVTTLAQRTNTFTVSYPVALNKQIAMKISNASVAGQNMVVGILMKGALS